MNTTGTVSGAAGGNGPSVAGSSPSEAETSESAPALSKRQPSRSRTKAITVHFPEEVRRQLKAMAGEQGRDVSDMVAEALNLLFARYNKTELAPRKLRK